MIEALARRLAERLRPGARVLLVLQPGLDYVVALFSFGEGLQKNHHAFPTSARHGLTWYEPDIAGWTIVLGRKLGLICEVKHPTPAQIENKRLAPERA